MRQCITRSLWTGEQKRARRGEKLSAASLNVNSPTNGHVGLVFGHVRLKPELNPEGQTLKLMLLIELLEPASGEEEKRVGMSFLWRLKPRRTRTGET